MINAGLNIRAVDDQLKKIPVHYLFDKVRNPDANLKNQIRQLRVIESMDREKYRTQKCMLPYIVCGIFNPPYRKTENFAYTDYFMLDIDHISSKGISVEALRLQLQQDSRVVMSFLSPSRDGLKLLFRLKERCMDSGLYTIFYRAFASSFSKQYSLEQVVDAKTCDVTRACFFSEDENAYFNPQSDLVDMNSYIDTSNTYDLFDQKKKVEKEMKDLKESLPEEEKPTEPGDETMDRIKGILNPKAVKKIDKMPVFVPKILDDIMADLKRFIEQTGAVVASVKNINYGKQIMVKVGIKFGEVNFFYGKRGFTVVRTTKSGTDRELTECIGQMVETFLATYEYTQHG